MTEPQARAPRPVKQRRSLTHVGGGVEVTGDRTLGAALARALDVAPRADEEGRGPADDIVETHVHGFHTYPARMHPTTAARLVAAIAPASGVVLDPFCGSGTVLVEARLAARPSIGTDLNPLAVRLAALKSRRFGATSRAALTQAARQIAEYADDRRKRRAGASQRYSPDDVRAFDPHVLLELDSLRAGIEGAGAGLGAQGLRIQNALALVLSAMLVKLSRRSSDTSEVVAPRRLAAGYTAKLFVRKTDELARRMGAFADALPKPPPPVRVELDDATQLQTVGASTVDAVVTSPPYVATYDYVAHHALRLRWLGLESEAFAAGELGSRRRYANLDAEPARRAWSRELGLVFAALSRVCRTGARVALLMADSAVGGAPLRADATTAPIAQANRFVLLARAAQLRPHFHGPTASAFRQAPRAEHAMLFEKR